MPINNSPQLASDKPGTQNIHAMQQPNGIRYLKEDLELLIQQLRNLQKQRTAACSQSNTNFETFIKSIEKFSEKSSKKMNSIIIDTNGQESELQMRQLQSLIKNQSGMLGEGTNKTDYDTILSQISKSFNEYMQVLDKLNLSYNQSSNTK